MEKLKVKSEFELHKELKRIDGFDVNLEDENSYYRSLYTGMLKIFNDRFTNVESIFGVACGSGANLVLFMNRGK